MARKILFAIVVLIGVWGIFCALIYWAMCQPPDVFGRTMARVPMATMMVLPFQPMWFQARSGRLTVGDAAPDFELSGRDRVPVRLSSFRGKQPVVLIFGSYT